MFIIIILVLPVYFIQMLRLTNNNLSVYKTWQAIVFLS